MTEHRDPDDYAFKSPMTARRETPPTSKVGHLVSRGGYRCHRARERGTLMRRVPSSAIDPSARGRQMRRVMAKARSCR